MASNRMLALLVAFASVVLRAHADLAAIDAAVLNFALNLEYLEANFYSCAAYGKPIGQPLWGTGGVAPVGCQKANLSNTYFQLADEIAQDEIAHVRLLRSVLGDAAVPQPAMNIGSVFAAAANAAASLALNMSVTLKPEFSPYASDVFFLHGAFIFEDVGVTAYGGAATLLVDKNILSAAARILAVEAYHSGAVRFALGAKLMNAVAFTKPELRVRDVVAAISDLRDAVDGPSDDDQGVVRSTGNVERTKWHTNIVPTDDNGLTFTRNTDQVLRIVYLGGASSGGFFPNGLNGAITAVSA